MNGRDLEPGEEPKGRVAVGVFAIIGWMILWIVLVASASATVGAWPVLLQMLFYLVTGLVWILPLKPALRWMNAGR